MIQHFFQVRYTKVYGNKRRTVVPFSHWFDTCVFSFHALLTLAKPRSMMDYSKRQALLFEKANMTAFMNKLSIGTALDEEEAVHILQKPVRKSTLGEFNQFTFCS